MILDKLLLAGADIDIKDRIGETPLHKILGRPSEDLPISLLERFLYHKADIEAYDNDQQQPLYEIASGGSVEAMRLLLNHDPKPDIAHVDSEGRTALHNAADGGVEGRLEICRMLVISGADPAKKDDNLVTPFFQSCMNDHLGTIEYLADLLVERKSSDLLDCPVISGKTALRKSAAMGKFEVVKLLLTRYRKHINIDAVDNAIEWTSLHIAAYKGLADIVEILIDYGARPDIKTKRGLKAITLCYQQWEQLELQDSRNTGYEKCLIGLINADRAAAIADQNILSAAAKRGSIAVLETLITGPPGQPKADPVLRDEYGWTAIELAKQYRRHEAVSLLLDRGGLIGRYPSKWIASVPSKAVYNEEVAELRYIKDHPGDAGDLEESVAVFSDLPIPANVPRYYYEISIEYPDPVVAKEEKHAVGMGLFQQNASKHQKGLETCFPGDHRHSKRGLQSWAYHGDDGFVGNSIAGYHDSMQKRGPIYGHGDTVGCGVDFDKGIIFWTLNGERLSTLVLRWVVFLSTTDIFL